MGLGPVPFGRGKLNNERCPNALLAMDGYISSVPAHNLVADR